MDRENFNRDKKRAALLSLIVGIILFGVKLIVLFLTGSTAVYSDAAESVVHIAATLMVLYSIYLAAKPPDKTHLYGHGNVEYFSAGIEGILILVAAGAILYEAILHLVYPTPPENLGYGMVIVVFIALTNLILGFYLIKKGKATNSLILEADGKHILTDSATTAGVFIGLLLVKVTGITIIDPIVAIVVAVNIVYTGTNLIKRSISGLMLEANPETLEKIANKILELRKDFWIDVHQLRYRESADQIFIDFHLILPYYFSIKEAHDVEENIAHQLKRIFNNCEVRIHHDYCTSKMCKYCSFKDCKLRDYPQTINIKWDIDKLISEPPEDLRNHGE
jgi:cation diffusion facilitator family transporter